MQSDRIAFGTDATDFFVENEEIKKGTTVLIYASRKSSGAKHLFIKGRATFKATFDTWKAPDHNGTHSVPRERAGSTWDDTIFKGFWVVTDFKRLPEKQWVAFSKLKAINSNKPLQIPFPRGPMLVKWI